MRLFPGMWREKARPTGVQKVVHASSGNTHVTLRFGAGDPPVKEEEKAKPLNDEITWSTLRTKHEQMEIIITGITAHYNEAHVAKNIAYASQLYERRKLYKTISMKLRDASTTLQTMELLAAFDLEEYEGSKTNFINALRAEKWASSVLSDATMKARVEMYTSGDTATAA